MWVVSIRKERILMVFYTLLIIGGLAAAYHTESAPAFAMPVSKKVVVLDAGHGSWDPGMVEGLVEEKEINLNIMKKLQAYLEQGGATVLVTRDDDTSLADTKAADLRSRSQTANTGHADIFISIHQNAYPNPNVRGAQVFYFNESDNSKRLGESIQNQLKDFADPDNKFLPKPNAKYYVLKQTTMPAVIVECGFLTNSAERAKLVTDEYQERLAWGIYLGIVDYFNQM